MSTPRISVIIPVYNNAQTLPATLESIAAQTLKPHEILICNDGSPNPDVKTYLQTLGKKYQGIPLKIFHQSNAGAGAARNRCLAHATGEFIAFLDADDTWLPQKLERSLSVLNETGATFVAHDFFAVTPDGTQTHWHCTTISKRKDPLSRGNPRTQYFYRGFIGILTVVIRKEALLKAGGFDSLHRYALDWDCWHAVLATNPGSFFAMFPEPLAHYSLNPNGLTAQGIKRLAERESYLPRYVRGVATAGGVPWPLLLLRGWLTIQYETAVPLLRQRRYRSTLGLLLRAPITLIRLTMQTIRTPYQRPNFITAADK